MNAEGRPPATRARLLSELAFPVWIAVWRLTWYDVATLWRDWALLVSLYWIFTIFARRKKAWAPVTVLLSLALLGIYLSRQLPLAIDTLRFAW